MWWDGQSRVYIDSPPEYFGKTQGLCGTFNENQRDDFTTPEGDVEQSAMAFANQWKTREVCHDVSLVEPSHPCEVNAHKKADAEKYCQTIKGSLFESRPSHHFLSSSCCFFLFLVVVGFLPFPFLLFFYLFFVFNIYFIL